LPGIGSRLHGLRGRHLLCGEFLEHQRPMTVILNNGPQVGMLAQIKLGHRLLSAMASDAIGHNERTHRFHKAVFEIEFGGIGRGSPARESIQEQENGCGGCP